jgi:hypothetical protein
MSARLSNRVLLLNFVAGLAGRRWRSGATRFARFVVWSGSIWKGNRAAEAGDKKWVSKTRRGRSRGGRWRHPPRFGGGLGQQFHRWRGILMGLKPSCRFGLVRPVKRREGCHAGLPDGRGFERVGEIERDGIDCSMDGLIDRLGVMRGILRVGRRAEPYAADEQAVFSNHGLG